jgi:hypothetical protein
VVALDLSQPKSAPLPLVSGFENDYELAGTQGSVLFFRTDRGAPRSRVVAMKGRWPPAADSDDAGALPRGWRLEQVQAVTVPGLDAARHILKLRRVT